ncbi:putative G-protein coupled receptor 139 [Mustelus asterias]
MEQPVIIQIQNIYYPILAIVGVPANLVTIITLAQGNCGLSKCITRYLVTMAAADLMVLIFEITLYVTKDVNFSYSFLKYTPVCSFNQVMMFISIDCSVWLTVAFTFDRFIAICHQSLQRIYCTEKTATVVTATVCLVCIIENIPISFIYEPREVIDNTPFSCKVKSSFYILTIWKAFLWLETILTPFAPFVLILLLNLLTIRHIIMANRVRSGLRKNADSHNHTDQEVENRRKSIILLLAISGCFLLLWTVNFIFFVLVQFTDIQFLTQNYNDPSTIAEQCGYMLRALSSCTNTFIYGISQRKFREELKSMIRYPKTAMYKIISSLHGKVMLLFKLSPSKGTDKCKVSRLFAGFFSLPRRTDLQRYHLHSNAKLFFSH